VSVNHRACIGIALLHYDSGPVNVCIAASLLSIQHPIIVMPELPEVEVTRRGVAPYLEGRTVSAVVMRHSGLRWPFPVDLPELLAGRRIRATGRRGKYLLIHFDHGTLIVHLGMSGHLRILPPGIAAQKHDHFDLEVGGKVMRMTDPRRFGAVLWHAAADGDIEEHTLLRGLGLEPLEDKFSAQVLHRQTRNRSAPIKQVLLAGDIVVGVGNIYASESLFKAGINPKTAAGKISLARYEKLVVAIRETLVAVCVTLLLSMASPVIFSRAILFITVPAWPVAFAHRPSGRSSKDSALPFTA